jgi:PTH1 family peptidyl-tRNA hydrolase
MIILLVQLTGMKFIFGLGNPGEKYAQTRHNVGFRVVDALAKKIDAGDLVAKDKFRAEIVKQDEVLLGKPQTYMNQSGQAVRSILDFYQIDIKKEFSDLFVIHDDLDIELGRFKVQFGVGPKVHHGLQSIYQYLKTDQFWHVRVGIDGRAGDRTIPGEAYVLQNFLPTELELFNTTVEQVVTELKNRIV